MNIKNFFKKKEREKRGPKFMFTTRDLGHRTGNGERIGNDSPVLSQPSEYSVRSIGFDGGTQSSAILNYYTINDSINGQFGQAVAVPGASSPTEQSKKEDTRKAVEPKAVFEEVKRKTPDVSWDRLDEKIKVVSDRINVLKEHLDESHMKDEHTALFFLKNRRNYLKTKKKFPMNWATTNREAVDALCKTYKLKVVAIKQFYTMIPKDGITEMDRFTQAYKAVTGDNPIFELIIKDVVEAKKPDEVKEVAKQKKKDRDPILLANSPFGNSLFVLGAWDDEVEVVDEIIYGLK